MIYGKNVSQLMDPNLMGNFSIEEATIVFQLASQCLQYEDQENPNIKDLVATLEALQTKTEVTIVLKITVIEFLFFFGIHVQADVLIACRFHLMKYLK